MNTVIDAYRSELIAFVQATYSDIQGNSIQSEIPCLGFNIAYGVTTAQSIMYEPCLCIILQGSKEVGFGNKMYRYDPYQYLLASTHIPSDIKIGDHSRVINLGDWIYSFTYGVLDGKKFELKQFRGDGSNILRYNYDL